MEENEASGGSRSMPNKQRSNKPTARRLKEANVELPLSHNDGSPVPARTLEKFLDELFTAFDGWTIEGKVKGAYRMQNQERQVEDLLKVSIVLDAVRIAELEAMVSAWCAELEQEVMLMKV